MADERNPTHNPEHPVPMLSIGMPVYNGAAWIGEAIESILSQSLDDLELIIVDNASNDDTATLCRDYAATDRRVHYRRNESNIGVFANYNRAMRLSRGRYFKWASSNDVCGPGFFECCVAALEADPRVVLAYPKTKLFQDRIETAVSYTEHFDLSADDPFERFCAYVSRNRLNNIFNGVYRSRVLKSVPDQKPFLGSDCNLLAELLLHGPFVEVDGAVFYRRIAAGSFGCMLEAEERDEFYGSELNKDFPLNEWKVLLEYYAGVWRTPMAPRQKLALLGFVSRLAVWERQTLARQLRHWLSKRWSAGEA